MKKVNIVLLVSILCFVAWVPLKTVAQEMRNESSAKSITKTLTDVNIVSVSEDYLLIDKKRYRFTGQTIFIKKVKNKESRVAVRELVLPCRARITYDVFTHMDEANPHQKNQRILTKVFIY